MGYDPATTYWSRTWIDEMSDSLFKRKIKLVDKNRKEEVISANKTIMDYAL